MKTLFRLLIVFGILGGIGVAAYYPIKNYFDERNRPKWRTQSASVGDIAQTVNSTGKVEPIHRVSVGASVSGPISELFVDYNSEVVEGQLLARIDPRIYKSTVERDRAQLLTRQAEVARAQAQQQQAAND